MGSDATTQRSWFWWLYAAYLALAFTAGAYNSVRTSITPLGVLALVLDTVALIGFYGFIRQRPIFSAAFWQLFALIYIAKYIALMALLAYVAAHLLPSGGLTKNVILWSVAGDMLALGVIYALYMYAFRLQRVWNSRKPNQLD